MTGMTTIGPAGLLESAPTVVTVNNRRYILSRREDGKPALYSGVCPHQHGRVKVVDTDTLRCPNHRWEFDPATGDCRTVGGEALEAYPVSVVDGELRATLE